MKERRSLATPTQTPGLIVRRAKARLLRDIGAANGETNGGVTLHPRLYAPFGPAEIWEEDRDYDEVEDADPADVFAITDITPGPNATLEIASDDDSIFLEHDRLRITESSGDAGAADGINDKKGHCIADAVIDAGTMTIATNLTLSAADDLGSVVRLVPPPRLIGRVVQVVNRWHDETFLEGAIVDIEQEDGSEWWDIKAGSCTAFEDE